MDTEILARIQFAFTIAFHYIYQPLSIILIFTILLLLQIPWKTCWWLYALAHHWYWDIQSLYIEHLRAK